MITDKITIKKMLKSSDKESIYLGACLIRKNPSIGIELLLTIPIEDRIKTYEDICEELAVKPLMLEDFVFLPEIMRKKQLAIAKLTQIMLLFNGDWIVDLTNSNQTKWYPYFDITRSGLSFRCSAHDRLHFSGAVAYFKTESIADFVGKLFVDIYKDLY